MPWDLVANLRGLDGPPGPSEVSSDANNMASLGSDNKIYVGDIWVKRSGDTMTGRLTLEVPNGELFIRNSPFNNALIQINVSFGILFSGGHANGTCWWRMLENSVSIESYTLDPTIQISGLSGHFLLSFTGGTHRNTLLYSRSNTGGYGEGWGYWLGFPMSGGDNTINVTNVGMPIHFKGEWRNELGGIDTPANNVCWDEQTLYIRTTAGVVGTDPPNSNPTDWAIMPDNVILAGRQLWFYGRWARNQIYQNRRREGTAVVLGSDGALYLNLMDNNVGNDPTTSPTHWKEI